MKNDPEETKQQPGTKTNTRKIEVTVEDKRGTEQKNPWLNPTVLSAFVGAVAGLLATLLTIMSGDNQLSRLLTKADSIDTRLRLAVPVGTIVAYGGPIDDKRRTELLEAGWLICDGSNLPREDRFTKLSSLLGRLWGPGNGSDAVSLPDLTGQFLRGIDSYGKNDPNYTSRTNWNGDVVGPQVGSMQGDQFREHFHGYTIGTGTPNSLASGTGRYVKEQAESNKGGEETRPKNAYVYYLIKY